MHLCKSFRWGEERLHRSPKSFRWGEERLHRSPKSFRWGEERLHRSPKSFRWGEERLHRSPKSLRWDEEPLYRSPRVSGGRAESQKPDSFKGLVEAGFWSCRKGHPVRGNNQWGIRKTPTD